MALLEAVRILPYPGTKIRPVLLCVEAGNTDLCLRFFSLSDLEFCVQKQAGGPAGTASGTSAQVCGDSAELKPRAPSKP